MLKTKDLTISREFPYYCIVANLNAKLPALWHYRLGEKGQKKEEDEYF